MSQISHGTITISDLTDITDVYLQYGLALANATVTNSYTFSGTGEVGWNTTYPTWQSGYQIWIRQVTEKEGLPNEYGTPYLDTAVNQLNTTISAANANITALQTRTKKIWVNLNNSTTYPAGTYAASGINNGEVTENNSSTYGYNTFLTHNKLALRYNAIDMAALTTNILTFYTPTQDSNNNWIQGEKGVELSTNGLILYNPAAIAPNNKGLELNANGLYLYKPLGNGEVTQTTAAQLTATGLNITEGSITLGKEENNTCPFQVTNDGYLRAQAGWIGGENSYVKLEESAGDEGEVTHYLDVRLSQLDMLLNSDLYERNNIVNVLDIVAQQSDFITLWSGDMVWLYYPEPGSEYYSESHDGEPYLIYEYTNNDTNTTSYYFDAHQFDLNNYKLTQDTQILEKEYFNRLEEQIQNPTGNPKSNGWYEYDTTTGEYFPTIDPLVRYIETADQTYQEGKQYYYLDGDNYVTLEPGDWGEMSGPYYEMKTYYELKFILIDVTDYEGQSINPTSQGWYEAEVSLWVEHNIYKAYNGSQILADENFSDIYYEIVDQMYVLTNDIDINEDKTYYTRSGAGTDESPYVYTEVIQTDSSELKYYYELVDIYQLTNDSAPDASKTYYKMLPTIQIAGLGQALKFENDSLGNQQRLIVSSARNDEQEKVQVEIDPWFINFAVRSDGILPLLWNMGYTRNLNDENDLGSTYMSMRLEDRTILTVNESNDYFLETNTGFRIQSLGMFHYKNGLAIGVV